jgi:cytochrome c oxidase cbb3-type subunit IV
MAMNVEYESMRQFADTWGLLVMALFFVGVLIFIFRPGARKASNDAAHIPFNEE